MDLCQQSKLLSCNWSNIDVVSTDLAVAWVVTLTKFGLVSIILLQPIKLGEYLSLAGTILWKINQCPLTHSKFLLVDVLIRWKVSMEITNFISLWNIRYFVVVSIYFLLSLQTQRLKKYIFERRLQCTNLLFMKFVPDEY